MKQEGAHVSFLIGSGKNPKEIGDVGVGGPGPAVESFPDRTQTDIRRNDSNSAGDRGSVHAITRERSDSRRTPQRRRRIQTGDVETVSEDYARSQEPDSRDNLSCNPKTVIRTRGKRQEHDKQGGPRRDERVRAQASHALPPLPLSADEGPQDQGQSQTNCKLMPKHFRIPSVGFFLANARAHPRRFGWGCQRIDEWRFLYELSGRINPKNCKGSHSLVFLCVPRERAGVQKCVTLRSPVVEFQVVAATWRLWFFWLNFHIYWRCSFYPTPIG